MWELVAAANWNDLVPRLLAYTRYYLSQYGEIEGRRWQKITHSYVYRAIDAILKEDAPPARANALFPLLCQRVAQLVDNDERKLQQLLEATDWTDMIPRVIAHTVRKLGARTSRHGKSPEDYVYNAVLRLFTHHRHFPFDRDVSLFAFLCTTVHGMRTNDLARLASEGEHVPLTGQAERELMVEHRRGEASLLSAADRFIASLEPELQEYARLRALEMHRTTNEYAAALGVTVETIRNYDRRLRRRRKRWNT